MLQPVFRHLRGNAVAYVALFIALGGTAYAASLPANSVGTRQLQNGAVTSKKVARNTTVPNASHLGGLAPSAFQRRLSSTCAPDAALQKVESGGAFLCAPIESQMLGGTGGVTISPSSTEFLAPVGLSKPTVNAAAVTVGTPPSGGTANGLSVILSTAPGSGNEWLFTLEINGSATGPSCLIADLDTFCTNPSSDDIPVPPNANLVLQVRAIAGTPAATSATFGWVLFPGS